LVRLACNGVLTLGKVNGKARFSAANEFLNPTKLTIAIGYRAFLETPSAKALFDS